MQKKNEELLQYEEADEAGKIKNLKATMQLLLQQYQDFANRKERLENKALGYLTPLSILLVATVAILIMIIHIEEKELTYLLLIFSFMGQVFFSIFTFFFALKAYSVKTSWYPDIKDHSLYWTMKETDYLGRINNAFNETIEELERILKKLGDDVENCRMFLIFSMVFGILNISCFILYALDNFMRR